MCWHFSYWQKYTFFSLQPRGCVFNTVVTKENDTCVLCFYAVVPSAATIVIVVCVSFLAFMIILGVFRIRAAHQKTVRDHESGKENEMDWDDSALTITVNPMEVSCLEMTALTFLTFESVCVCVRASLLYAKRAAWAWKMDNLPKTVSAFHWSRQSNMGCGCDSCVQSWISCISQC